MHVYFCCLHTFTPLRHCVLLLSLHIQPSADVLYFYSLQKFNPLQTFWPYTFFHTHNPLQKFCTSVVFTYSKLDKHCVLSTFCRGFVLLLSLHIQLFVHICIYAVFTHIQYSADILCFCFAIFKYPVLCRLLCFCPLHILNSLQKCVFLMYSQIQFSGLFLPRINAETVHFRHLAGLLIGMVRVFA